MSDEEDAHIEIHIYDGDSALVVREGGNKTLYGVQLPELLALFDREIDGPAYPHIEECREQASPDEREQCERCKDWEQRGLSRYCPSCDAEWLAQLEARAPADELKRLKTRIDTRLNNALCEMKPEYDDSIHGFNEAWDIVSEAFSEALAHPSPPIDGLVERLTAERDAAVYELKRFHEVRNNAPDWEKLWAEQTEAREASEAKALALTTAAQQFVDCVGYVSDDGVVKPYSLYLLTDAYNATRAALEQAKP